MSPCIMDPYAYCEKHPCSGSLLFHKVHFVKQPLIFMLLPLPAHNKFGIIRAMDTLEVTSKPLVILHGEIKTPPLRQFAREGV